MSQARQFTGTLIQRKTACAAEDNMARKAVALAPASPADPGPPWRGEIFIPGVG
jgi:hypothetical protein